MHSRTAAELAITNETKWNESVPKKIINDNYFYFLNCNQHRGNFKPKQFPSIV